MFNNESYAVLRHQYENTGGNCMVAVDDVYYRKENKTLYLIVNEEGYSISTIDHITTDASEYIDDYDKITLTSGDWNDINFRTETGDFIELISYGYQEYIKDETKHFKHNQRVNLEQLPIALYNQLSAEYIKWLKENEFEVETNGEYIIMEADYEETLIKHEQYILDCKELLEYMNTEIAKSAKDEPEDALQKFYDYQATIGFAGKQIILPNIASVFSALTDALEYIIDQE